MMCGQELARGKVAGGECPGQKVWGNPQIDKPWLCPQAMIFSGAAIPLETLEWEGTGSSGIRVSFSAGNVGAGLRAKATQGCLGLGAR
eukprot:8480178-Karenia_brevis.AAC.1